MENKKQHTEEAPRPVSRKTNEEIDTNDDGTLTVHGEPIAETPSKGSHPDQFEGVED